jgi:hypothetical protein
MSRKISELLSDIPAGKTVSAELLDMLQEGCSLQQILDYSYKILENPVMLVDVTFNYEASAGTDTLDDEPVWEYTVKNGFMPNYYLNHIAGLENLDAEDSFLMEEEAGKLLNHFQLAARVIHGGRLMGHVMLLEKNREVSHDDRMFLQLISGFLSISMVRKLSSDDFRFSVIENFLTSIIRNEITNPEEIESRQELFGIKLYDVLHVITIEVRDFRTSDDKKYNLLRKVRKLFDRNNVIKLNDYIVVLYDTKTFEDAFSEEMLSEFTALLEKYDCEANISYPFHDLNDFYRYYVQTVYCMDIREVMDLRDPIVKYNEVIEYHMLLTFSEQTDLDLLLNDAIKELQKADSDNDSDYTNTLFTYVNCQQNISRAAERMQLHYNTLKYRINRIISMTGIDMNDENTVFSIMISERVLKIKEYLQDHNSDIQGFFDSEWVRHSALPGSWKIK